MSKHITLRLDEEEIKLLTSIALDNGLTKSNNKLSESKAIKLLLKNEINKRKNDKKTSNIELLIEQIHSVIPHLIYNTNTTLLFNNFQMKKEENSNESILNIKQKSINRTKEMCGQFQDYNYQKITCETNNKNMKTLPISNNKNKWKS